jgi:2-iminoacetate synthase
MFSDRMHNMKSQVENIGPASAVDQNTTRSLLEKSACGFQLDPDEVISLLSATYQESNRRMILDFSRQYSRPHDKEVLLLPPLYFSNICENDCPYCDFSSVGSRLSPDEFQDEVDSLLNLGYRSIELVSSQDPDLYLHRGEFSPDNQKFRIESVLQYFELARNRLREKGGGMLTSNIPPVDTDSFRELRKAGLDCFLIWLEVFDPDQYRKLHGSRGPKSSQEFRVDSFENARSGGIKHLAGAFLKGLYDWRKEVAVLYLLDDYLKTKYGRGFSIIGTPRLKGPFQDSPIVAQYSVSDEDFELNIALDRILFDGILWLQTRESFPMNRNLINQYGGGVILTLTSCTAPGGYAKPSASRSQFPIHSQKLLESVRLLEEDEYRVIFDWDGRTLDDFQRDVKIL